MSQDNVNNDIDPSENLISLDTLFYYQNEPTGKVQGPLRTDQICQFLNNKAVLTGQTLVIAAINSTQKQWQPLQQIPVFQHFLQSHYYCVRKTHETQGPVTLAKLQEIISIHQDEKNEESMILIYDSLDKAWKSWKESPSFCLALRALENIQQRQSSYRTTTGDDDINTTTTTTATTYESDNGTKYIRDPITQKWIHPALVQQQQQRKDEPKPATTTPQKRKVTSHSFAPRNAKCWIYMTGLPKDTTIEEIANFCKPAGLLDIDPLTHGPKIKLYKKKNKEDPSLHHSNEELKGDASVCFARPESVELAFLLLQDAYLRPSLSSSSSQQQEQYPIHIERAQFHKDEEKSHVHEQQNTMISHRQRKFAKMAIRQQMQDNENPSGGGGSRNSTSLTIVVLHNFVVSDKEVNDEALQESIWTLCDSTRKECLSKVTWFQQSHILVLKFHDAKDATATVEELNGKPYGNSILRVHFWDGVTDYSSGIRDDSQEKETSRLEAFGEWLDNQEVPDDLQLQSE